MATKQRPRDNGDGTVRLTGEHMEASRLPEGTIIAQQVCGPGRLDDGFRPLPAPEDDGPLPDEERPPDPLLPVRAIVYETLAAGLTTFLGVHYEVNEGLIVLLAVAGVLGGAVVAIVGSHDSRKKVRSA